MVVMDVYIDNLPLRGSHISTRCVLKGSVRGLMESGLDHFDSYRATEQEFAITAHLPYDMYFCLG